MCALLAPGSALHRAQLCVYHLSCGLPFLCLIIRVRGAGRTLGTYTLGWCRDLVSTSTPSPSFFFNYHDGVGA